MSSSSHSRGPSVRATQGGATKSFGLFDLRVVQDLCSPRTRTNFCEVVYKFDGRRYRPVSYAPTKRGGLF